MERSTGVAGLAHVNYDHLFTSYTHVPICIVIPDMDTIIISLHMHLLRHTLLSQTYIFKVIPVIHKLEFVRLEVFLAL